MESVKLAGIAGHGPQMLYQSGRQPTAPHPNAPPIIRPSTTRSYEGSPYKPTISPPLASRAGYASYGHLDNAHQAVGARYIPQPPSAYVSYPSRESHYARPMADHRPSLLLPHAPRRPSIMGTYGGYNTKDIMHQIMTSSSMPANAPGEPFKRMKLSQGMRSDVMYSPLVVETSENHTSRQSSYYPQVEAISPTLPPDPRDESPLHSTQDDLLKQIEQVDKEIMMIESSITNLHKKEETLKAAAQKGDSQSQHEVEDVKEPKHQSTAQIIYAENRAIADESHYQIEKTICSNEDNDRVLPYYNQPKDCEVYKSNRLKYNEFRQVLMQYFKRIQETKTAREHKLIQTYNRLMADWLRKVDKIENSKRHKEKTAKNRELFEKVFPELRKQREEKERFTRVGARVKSDAEMEEIMDGLQEQEMEDKKMRSYAVIPPIMLDERQRRYKFINKNGLLKNPLEDYKEHKNINIWTEHECEIFKEKFLQHPKNFALISSFLEKKSVSDSIQHYYLTKKKENYKLQVKRRMRRPRAKAAQTHIEPIHLNARVRTRGSAQKELLKTEVSSSSNSCNSEPNVTSSNSDEVTTNGPATSQSETWQEQPVETGTEQNGPIKSTSNSSITNSISMSNDVTEMDKENLTNSEKCPRRKDEKLKGDVDSSDEEPTDGTVSDCIVCKSRDYTNSRPLKPGTASQYGLKEEDVPANARVCTNCRCRAVRRTRQYVCQLPTCTTPKWKVKRLRPFPPRWNTLLASVKDPIISEFEIPADVTKSCSSCHSRILRKLGCEAEEPLNISDWSDSDIDALRQALREFGCHWSKVAERIGNKDVGQIRSFFSSLKEKYKLDEAVAEYKKIKGKSEPPIVTDEEESGSSTSSAEETGSSQPPLNPPSQVRHDSASDTLSASSPPPPINSLDEKETTTIREAPITNVPGTADYDSSATTVSADECGVERDSPPEIEHIPHPGEKRPGPPSRRPVHFPNNTQGVPEGAVFQEIISKTISASLPDSDKPHIPGREITMETLLQPFTTSFIPSSSSYNQYPPQEEQDEAQAGCLDLTVKKRDRSPPHRPNSQLSSHINSQPPRKELIPIPARGSGEGNQTPIPLAHSNSTSYPGYNMPDRYYPEHRKSPAPASDSRALPPQNSPASIIQREPSPLTVYPSRTPTNAKLPKSNMAPPAPIAVSSPGMAQIYNLAQNSTRRLPPKSDKSNATIHGSITLGTPVNQAPHAAASLSHPSSRYDNMVKTMSNREGGSITQGTPVHHDSKRPPGLPQGLHLKDSQMLEQAAVEIVPRPPHDLVSPDAYRNQRGAALQGAQNSSYPFPSYSNYQQRPSYSDSQITSREILKNDYLTSQQMQGRRANPNDKDYPPSRGREPSPQSNVKDARIYPVPVDRRAVEPMSTMIDPRVDRRSEQRKELGNMEFRGLEGRSVIQDRDKSRQFLRTTSGIVPTHYYQSLRNHPDYRGASRPLSSPASNRDATPTPPNSEPSHDYRTTLGGHPLPSHSRVNTVIQTANKLPIVSSIQRESGRHSPHSSVMQGGAEYVASPRRDGKPIEGLGSVMIGNRHLYDHRQPSREKSVHQVMTEDKRYAERRERQYKEDDSAEKHAMNKYAMDMKNIHQKSRQGDGVQVKNLVDCIIRRSISRSGSEDSRPFRRDEPPASHVYSNSSETDKRVRSPAYTYHQKDKEMHSNKDPSDGNVTHRSQLHKDPHPPSLNPSLASHYSNMMKGQQHIEAMMSREISSGLDLKKITSNHHGYTRPSHERPALEITRTDARTCHISQNDQDKMQSSSSILYPIDVESKERYDSKSPHRLPTSTQGSQHHRDHMNKDERSIVRMPLNAQPHSENINPFDFMRNKIQQIWREDSPEKERRPHENSRLPRSGTPSVSQRQIRVPHQSPSGRHSNMNQVPHSQPQTIRSNSHFEDEQLKKRSRIEIPQDIQTQRPPSRPVSSGAENKEYHREDDADSPQSGEMVIDENPNRDSQNAMKANSDMSAGRSGAQVSQLENLDKQERPKSNSYPNVYRGYPSHSSGHPVPPHTSSWGVVNSVPSKNGCFQGQGYEPNVEPVSDDE